MNVASDRFVQETVIQGSEPLKLVEILGGQLAIRQVYSHPLPSITRQSLIGHRVPEPTGRPRTQQCIL